MITDPLGRLPPNAPVTFNHSDRIVRGYRDPRENMEGAQGFKALAGMAGFGFTFVDYVDEGITWIRGHPATDSSEYQAFAVAVALRVAG